MGLGLQVLCESFTGPGEEGKGGPGAGTSGRGAGGKGQKLPAEG